MIFVTVGSNQPFDRLIQAVDAWAKAHPSVDVFAQIGSGDFQPSHLRYTRSMSPADFRAGLEAAEIIVAHVGMGTIISALELGKSLWKQVIKPGCIAQVVKCFKILLTVFLAKPVQFILDHFRLFPFQQKCFARRTGHNLFLQ